MPQAAAGRVGRLLHSRGLLCGTCIRSNISAGLQGRHREPNVRLIGRIGQAIAFPAAWRRAPQGVGIRRHRARLQDILGPGSSIAASQAHALLSRGLAALPSTTQRAFEWLGGEEHAVADPTFVLKPVPKYRYGFFWPRAGGLWHYFGGLRLLRLLFRMTARDEPGRPEFTARKFHTPFETAIYLGGTSATRP